MLNKSLKLFSFTCIFGVFGFFFRWLQTMTAFDEQSGLAAPGSLWSIVLLVYMIAVTAALVLLVCKLKPMSFPLEYSEALFTATPLFNIICVAAAVIMALGGVLTLINSVTPPYSIFELITGLFAIVAAFCLVAVLRSTKRDHAEARGASAALVFDLFMCFWLIASYKSFASDPVIWNFAPRLLAICAGVLAFYYIAGYPYKKPKPLPTLFFSNLSAFLFIITFADNYSFGTQLLSFSCAAALCLFSVIIVSNAKLPAEE
ncbi:MAG: hypothetical protein KIG37_03920 [Oscillospiraceae bacterium]|nr:hypothetical protein [Oscillospiraceae bacterium]